MNSFKFNKTSPHKILMVGPHIQNHGGIATVQRTLLEKWDEPTLLLRQLATTKRGTKLFKLLFAIGALIKLIWLMIYWKPDLVHIHFSVNSSFKRKSIFALISKVFRRPLILHSHAPSFDTYFDNSGKLHRRYLIYILSLADLIIAVSESWRCYFQSILPTHKVIRIGNPISLPSLTERGCKNESPQIIMSLGQLCERKGTYDLIQAFMLLAPDMPNVELWLAGSGELNRVKKTISNSPFRNRIHILGFLDNAGKHVALSKASLFCLPSYNEGLPVAIIEAMSYEIAVVSSNIGGIPELVEDGVTGYLVDPGKIERLAQLLKQLLNDKFLRTSMGLAGRMKVERQFMLEPILGQLAKSYAYVLGEPCVTKEISHSTIKL